jgi:hypothetical protein
MSKNYDGEDIPLDERFEPLDDDDLLKKTSAWGALSP